MDITGNFNSSVVGEKKLFFLKVKIKPNSGNYSDGTTDVTRTIAFPHNEDMEFRRMFTLVLKGHIANAKLIFPDGINGKIHLFEY